MSKNQHSGQFEYMRFDARRENYYKGIEKIKNLGYSFEEILEHFPAFAGHMSLSRVFGLYELYKMSLGVAGHIADIGTYKGASALLFTKLIQIFESESFTQVHTFDWFLGAAEDVKVETKSAVGTYKESYERVMELINAQNLGHLVFVHKLDLTKELGAFLDKHLHLQFKMIFLDAGLYSIVKAVLPLLWDRLTPGGILVFDQFNFELAPGETLAWRELLPNTKVRTLPNVWMPTGYIVKE